MYLKIKYFLFILLFTSALTFTLLSCSGNPIVPPPPPPPAEPDSTTQNFTFETFEFGDGFESSYLNDVWVFNENNIWAVGFLSSKDTVIDGKKIYNTNIIKWNGSQWKLLPYSGTSSGVYGIWAQDSSTIYFANGLVFKYKNGSFVEYDFTNLTFSYNQSINKLWGSSESNVYGVGRNGMIVHFDGSKWTKIDFDTEWYFYGITGDLKTGVSYAFALNNSDVRIIVELNNTTATIIYKSKQVTALKPNAMSFIDSTLYVAGSDFSSTLIWKFNSNSGQIDSLYTLAPTTGINVITGSKIKDIYFWGSDFGIGKMVHYNGKRYKLFDLPSASDIREGASTRDNISAIVGFSNNKAYITIVKRQ